MMTWRLDNNYFSLFGEYPEFAEANRCLCSLATKLEKAVKAKDWDYCATLAQLFDKYQDKYQDIGASDTEPRMAMCDVVINACKSMKLTDEEDEMTDKVASWFRWWYDDSEENK